MFRRSMLSCEHAWPHHRHSRSVLTCRALSLACAQALLGILLEFKSLKNTHVPHALAGRRGCTGDRRGGDRDRDTTLELESSMMSSLKSNTSIRSGGFHRNMLKAGGFEGHRAGSTGAGVERREDDEERTGGSAAAWKARAEELERLLALAQLADAARETEREKERVREARERDIRNEQDGIAPSSDEGGEEEREASGAWGCAAVSEVPLDGLLDTPMTGGWSSGGDEPRSAGRFGSVRSIGGVAMGGAKAALGGLMGALTPVRAKSGSLGGALLPPSASQVDKAAPESEDVQELQKVVRNLRRLRRESQQVLARQRAHCKNSTNLLEAAKDVLSSACQSIPAEQQGELSMVMALLDDMGVELKAADDLAAPDPVAKQANRRKTM